MDDSLNRPFPLPVRVDESLPPGAVRIEAAETHLAKLRPDESVEFVAGPNDGLVVRTS